MDILQICPVYHLEDIRQYLSMVLNTDLAVVEKKVRLGVNIDNQTYLLQFVYRGNHFLPFQPWIHSPPAWKSKIQICYISSRLSQRKNLVSKSIHPSASVETCILFCAGFVLNHTHTNPAWRRKLLLIIFYLSSARPLHSPGHFSAGPAVTTVPNNKPSSRGSKFFAQTSLSISRQYRAGSRPDLIDKIQISRHLRSIKPDSHETPCPPV